MNSSTFQDFETFSDHLLVSGAACLPVFDVRRENFE